MVDFPVPVEAFTRMRIPKTFNGRNPQSRRDLASTLRARTQGFTPPPPAHDGGRRRAAAGAARRSTASGRSPGCAPSCGRTRATAARTARTTPAGPSATTSSSGTPAPCSAGSSSAPTRSPGSSTGSARCSTALGYLEDDEVTETGARLMRIYTDMDLVAAESLRNGLWDGLSPARAGRRAVRAGLRGPAARRRRRRPRLPGGRVQAGAGRHGLAVGRPRRAGARAQARLPARARPRVRLGGLPLGRGRRASTRCSSETDLAAGDFVRWIKQLLDLADQVADAAGDVGAAQDRPRDRPRPCAAAWSPTRLRVA